MLSDRIETLFTLLQCNNTDIARYAGCSSGNISKLKSGNRVPKPTSRTIAAFAEGVYRYADYEALLSVLCELCGAAESSREALIPALIAWLFETKDVTPPHAVTPRSKRAQMLRRQSFGEKLDRAMTVLELSNTQLAALLNIDVSLVSRYRSGIYSPHGNQRLSEKLSEVLLSRAEKYDRTSALAELCAVPAEGLDGAVFAEWLYGDPKDDSGALAQKLLRSLDSYRHGHGLPSEPPETPILEAAACYWGKDGLRESVIRFLTDAAREGGELLLYSDEPMDWMSGDREYFALWASLMAECIRNGVTIKIIHNVDRDGNEMVDAIRGWLPLYISGRIEPYVFRRERKPRFCHTLFLRPGGACIRGFSPADSGNERWYDYITDARHLDALRHEFENMLASASPFLKIFTAPMSREFSDFRMEKSGPRNYLLTALPVVTMPEGLLERMLSRAAIGEEQRRSILSFYRDARSKFFEVLSQHSVNMILCAPVEDMALPGRVNFALDLIELSVDYTPQEYAEHVAAVTELAEHERNFHLILLSDAPFRDIQIVTLGDAAAVLRCREPHTAFLCLNPVLTDSVSDYLSALIEQFSAERQPTIEALRNMQGERESEG